MTIYTVTTLADENDAGATVAAPGNSGLSLREAIALANVNAGADTITFANSLSGGTIRLTYAPGTTLVINEALTIDGDINNDGTPDITITGDAANNDTHIAGSATITDLAASRSANTLADNVQILGSSAALALDGLVLTGGVTAGSGGAVLANSTDVTLTNTTVSGNSADGFGGGGIYATNAVLTNTTVSGNSAYNGGGGIFAYGAAILTNTTISGNSAGFGGGIFVQSGTATLTNSSVSGNSTGTDGGGIMADNVILTNSIVAGNDAASNHDVRATTLSRAGGNIVGTDVFSGNTDVGDTALVDVFASVTNNPYTNVLSGTLANNGGGVQTIALKASLSNPALDASNSSAPATDATGLARVDQPGSPNMNGSAADLGAKELALFLPVITGTPGADSYAQPPYDVRIDALGGVDTVTFNFKLTEATVSYAGNTVVIDGPAGSHTVLTGFEVFNFTDGTVHNDDGNPLIDDLFYYSKYHDVWNAHVDADAHYNSVGWHEGRDPDAFFSTAVYLASNADVKAAGVNPLTHFDGLGWHEGRVPSISFDPAQYLAANPDVAAAHVDPLAHFLQFGGGEGRQPFAPTELVAANGFDYVYYLSHNPNVAAAGVDPFQHFETVGWKEGRNPNALFDVNGYLANYKDVAAAHINPLDHYDQFGWHEGRDPSVNFDTTSYLAAYADVAAAHINPLTHFLQFGIHEARSTFADSVWG